jgi:hypothetical protein
MSQPITKPAYSAHVLAAYHSTPGTTGQVRRLDRRLATELYDRGVPLDVVLAALLLAATRRITRPPGAHALPPIRSLHYFLPVVAEILDQPPAPGYVEYLRENLQRSIRL